MIAVLHVIQYICLAVAAISLAVSVAYSIQTARTLRKARELNDQGERLLTELRAMREAARAKDPRR